VFLFLSKLLDLLLAPLTWGLLLLAAGLLLWRRGRASGALVGLAIAVLYLFSTEGMADRLMHHAEASAPKTFRADATYDAVIVLGGLVDPVASRATGNAELTEAADRIVRTLELVQAGTARNVLVSGGLIVQPPGEPSEAERLAAKLRQWGVPADRIVVETRSRNTRENAVESTRVVAERGWRNLLLVTSAAHMPRALGCFRKVGLKPDALPVDYRAGGARAGGWLPRVSALLKSTDAIRELAGRVVYRVAGYAEG
jgi:uncharacterized SAM-binding protein YcdF (DUF218 family)